nr:unnamed protein product [Callosobruchus analis]
MGIFNTQLITTCIFLNVDRLHIIIHQLTSDILQLKAESHVQIAKQLKKSSDSIRKYYYSSLIFILLVRPALKFLARDKEPFYPTYIPPALGHIGILVFQEVMIAVAGYAGCNYCCLDMNLMTGISIQIETLKDILCQSDDIDVIFECIKRHQQIVRLVDNVQHIQRIGVSVNFFTGILLVCTTLFKILEMEVSELMFALPYSVGTMFVMFIHCWYGDDIIHRSAGITNAIFSSNWIDAKLSMQKTVILFMAFTKNRLRIRLAGGLFDMNLPIFASVCISDFLR